MENLKSVFNDVYDINEESSICGGCKRRFHKFEKHDTEVSWKYSSAGTILKPVGTKWIIVSTYYYIDLNHEKW